MNAPTYQVIVCRNGVPHETWEVHTADPGEAVAACKVARIGARVAASEHLPGDTYEAVDDEDVDDEDALLYAYADAASRMPALFDLLESRASEAVAPPPLGALPDCALASLACAGPQPAYGGRL